VTPEDRHWYNSAPLPAEIHPAESVEDSNLRFTFDHWRKLKGERRMPARAEILPKDIKHCLRYIHIYDVVDGGADFRARLVGTSVFPGLELDQTGKLVSQNPDPGIRLRFAALLRHVFSTAEPARSLSRRVTGSMLHDLYTEGLWLPLGEGGSVQHVLAQSCLRQVKPGTAEFGTKPAT